MSNQKQNPLTGVTINGQNAANWTETGDQEIAEVMRGDLTANYKKRTSSEPTQFTRPGVDPFARFRQSINYQVDKIDAIVQDFQRQYNEQVFRIKSDIIRMIKDQPTGWQTRVLCGLTLLNPFIVDPKNIRETLKKVLHGYNERKSAKERLNLNISHSTFTVFMKSLRATAASSKSKDLIVIDEDLRVHLEPVMIHITPEEFQRFLRTKKGSISRKQLLLNHAAIRENLNTIKERESAEGKLREEIARLQLRIYDLEAEVNRLKTVTIGDIINSLADKQLGQLLD